MTQQLSATVHLAGRMPVHLSTFGGRNEPGSFVRLVIAGIMLTCYERLAVERHWEAWHGETAILAKNLARSTRVFTRDATRDGAPLTVDVSVRGSDTYEVLEAGTARLALQIGWITWVCHDRDAYAAAAAAWTDARKLAAVILPKDRPIRPRPTGRRRSTARAGLPPSPRGQGARAPGV